MPSQVLPRMYVVGDISREEFSRARSWLDRHARTVLLPDLSTALQHLAADEVDPDALLLVQSRTGQHRTSLLDRWRQFTAAPPILLYGSWCEGETRSGSPLPNVPRLAWYHFAPRMAVAWKDYLSKGRTVFHTFRNVTDEARWHAELNAISSDRTYQIAIVSGSVDDALPIRDAFEAVGHVATVCDAPNNLDGFDLVVWDDSAGPRQPRLSLADTCDKANSTPVIAIATFPRIQECVQAYEFGCSDIVAKPFQIADLVWCIEHAAAAAEADNSAQHDAA